MRLSKARQKDFDLLTDFKNACENGLERQKFSFKAPEDFWEEWDDEDVEKKRIVYIKNKIAVEKGIAVENVDNRIAIFEWLQEKFAAIGGSWGRVTMCAHVLIENVCDPTITYVDFYPGFELLHVAPEQ